MATTSKEGSSEEATSVMVTAVIGKTEALANIRLASHFAWRMSWLGSEPRAAGAPSQTAKGGGARTGGSQEHEPQIVTANRRSYES